MDCAIYGDRAHTVLCMTFTDERRRPDLQTKLQHWLHGWLLIHVPISLLLTILTLWHAIIAVRLFVVNP